MRLLRGAAGIAHRTFAPHEIANRLYATQHRFGIHGCREGFMNAERKLRLHLPAGIASLLRQIAAGFVERDRVAIGERAKEQIRSSRIYVAGWSEGLFHLASIELGHKSWNRASEPRPPRKKNEMVCARFR